MFYFLFLYLSPIIAIIFFANCVSILKKVKEGKDVYHQTILCSIMFGYIVMSIIWSVFLSH